jgi:GNAT superfamily N-acetyltransferase
VSPRDKRTADADTADAPDAGAPGETGEPDADADTKTGQTDARPMVVERVPPEATYPLRGRVLRPGAPPDRVHLAADDHPETAAFAARDRDGTVVGTAIVYPEGCPWLPDRPAAWRLRGMATAEGRRSEGVGGRVIDAVLAHVAGAGGELVWCNARVPARRFYERAGFAVHGDEWVDPEIGPHVAMWREV